MVGLVLGGCHERLEELECRARFEKLLAEYVALRVVAEAVSKLRTVGSKDPLGELEAMLGEALSYAEALLFRQAGCVDGPLSVLSLETQSLIERLQRERVGKHALRG